MKLDETMEMAHPCKYLGHIVIGLEDALNKHLIKLFRVRFSGGDSGPSPARGARLARQDPWASADAGRPYGLRQVLFRPAVRLLVRWGRGAEHADYHGVYFRGVWRRPADEVPGGGRRLVEGVSHDLDRTAASGRSGARDGA